MPCGMSFNLKEYLSTITNSQNFVQRREILSQNWTPAGYLSLILTNARGTSSGTQGWSIAKTRCLKQDTW